ncbi:MAG: SDR family oxidoreductase [Opitutaceae bacterium]|nr:SDR family oxidoreductase [Opitutaceae bacterium]
MILVVGSTGHLGREICHQLATHGLLTRTLVRASADAARVEPLARLGASLAIGDLADRTSLAAACHGVDTVICTASAMPFAYQAGVNDIQSVDHDGVRRLIDAAQAAGVRHFVYTSFSGNLEIPSPLRDAKRAVEHHLRESGMSYTILRPSYFMEVWFSPAVGFDAASHHATIYGAGDRRISWISLHDVARFAVECTRRPVAHNTTLELGGPDALTPLEVVSIFETTLRQRFAIGHVLDSALHLRYAGATDPMEKSFAALMLGVVRGDWIPMAGLLRQIPVRLTTVQEYAEAMAEQPVAG